MMKKWKSMAAVVVLAMASGAWGDIVLCPDGCGEGTDGSLNLNEGETKVIDLALAPTGSWDDDSPEPGRGVFDPQKWAVVFKYTNVNVPTNASVRFSNHPSGAPVVWIVQGAVNITGTVDLNGTRGHNFDEDRAQSEPGPGGFRGGIGSNSNLSGSAGFGPGGARLGGYRMGSGGSYASLGGRAPEGGGPLGSTYGNPLILPLIGGSGAAGGNIGNSFGAGGGAGAGAILIASRTTITVPGGGLITANGGRFGRGGEGIHNGGSGGGGSGGAIRLVADNVTGTGRLSAMGGVGRMNGNNHFSGNGGIGRIRVEANSITLQDPGTPRFTVGLPGDPAKLWPSSMAPIIRVISLAGQDVSQDPKRSLNFPNQEILMSDGGTVPLLIQAFNVPSDAVLMVHVIPKVGADLAQIEATLVDEQNGIWQADVPMPSEISAVEVRAVLP